MSNLAYDFAVHGVYNTDAFYFTMLQGFELLDTTKNFDLHAASDPNVIDGVTMYAVKPIPSERLPELQALVTNYVEPSYYFPGYSHSESYPISSDVCNSSVAQPIYSWIFPGRKSLIETGKAGKSIVNKIKFLVEVNIDSINDASSLALATQTLTLDVVDKTRNANVMTNVVNLNALIQEWITEGVETPPGKFVTTIFTDVYNKNTDYDCIWQVLATLSDSRISARLLTMQFVCFNAPLGLDTNPLPGY